jgi:hypothetical protein
MKGLARTKIPKKIIQLDFKVKGHIGQPSTVWFNQLLEDIRRRDELEGNGEAVVKG